MRQLFAAGPPDLGDGAVVFAWSPRGAWLAAAGSKRVVTIFDRAGALVDEIHLAPREVPAAEPKLCSVLQLQWDAGGEVLAVLPAGCSFVYTWAAAGKALQRLDTDFRAQEVTMLAWSQRSAVLAVGTAKGNLQLYNTRERRRTPVVGKHTKRVCAGLWGGASDVLAMASLDKTVTVSDLAGDTIKSLPFRGEPLQLCLAHPKDERPSSARASQDASFSLITSKRVLYILQASPATPSTPLELSFLDSYGPMARHLWFGDGYVLVGFKSGQVVVVSSHSTEISREVASHRPLDLLADLAYCPALSRVAVGGGVSVKLLDVGATYGEVAGEGVELPPGHSVERVGWGQDGQVLTVSTNGGLLLTFLASLPSLYGAAGTCVANLTSLGEVTVTDVATRSSLAVQVACEPALISLGPQHLAVAMNNRALFYRHASSADGGAAAAAPGQLVNSRSYVGGVQALCLNATHAAVLSDGRLLVHAVEQQHGGSSDGAGDAAGGGDAVLPSPGAGGRQEPIVCAALSQQFVITAGALGSLCYHLLQRGELVAVNEHRHAGGAVTALYPQPHGPCLVLADERLGAGLYNPLTDELKPLPGFEGALAQVLWDQDDTCVFVAASSDRLFTYLLTHRSLSGQRLELLGTTPLPAGHAPVVLADGQLSVRLKSGALDSWLLDTHKPLREQEPGAKQLQKRLAAAIKLNRLPEALAAARALGTPAGWRQLAEAALQLLDVRLAMAAFRQVGDAAMVLSLAALEEVEDCNLLAGSLLVLLERDHDQAQELLLRSSRPLAALEMRRDLKHWPQALALAEQLAPASVAALSKEHAAMLELVGEHTEARSHYQRALESLAAGCSGIDQQLSQQCLAGMARTTLRLGDLQAGLAFAQQADSVELWRECAAILEAMQQLPEAAQLYERAGCSEKAASIHIAARNWAAAAPLMARVTSAKLQLQYARAKEGERAWGEAVEAYEAAGNLEAAVRLCLDKLGAVGRAAALARKSRSTAAAAAVARACLASGEVALAVEFLVLAGQLDQAFDLACAKGELATFVCLAADSVKSPADAERFAQYYDSRGQPEHAGDMWARARQPDTAIARFVQACSAASLPKAITLVEETRATQAAPSVLAALDACTGLDGALRDALRLRLNLAAGQLGEAAHDALEVARREQDNGNYKLAHAKLFATLQQLRGLGAAPPLEFGRALALLHSYVLVKSLLACGDHMGAARMLVRVAGSISRFPKHVVPILTSTVVECQRAGLKRTALEHASTLMRPEHRSLVSEKYRKKIELMVRKPDRGDEPAEALRACPFCALPGPECALQCVSCQRIIPFDIASGKRMCLDDWSECPSCRMPCSSAAFLAVLAAEGKCPMCGTAVAAADVQPVAEPLAAWAG